MDSTVNISLEHLRNLMHWSWIAGSNNVPYWDGANEEEFKKFIQNEGLVIQEAELRDCDESFFKEIEDLKTQFNQASA